jgi:endogenous inhibitor of DNA gyrase (YacG/DUF329 family)
MAERLVNCPRCGDKVMWSSGNPWRPFCSEHCKTMDLGAWATESYRIPVVEYDDIDDEDLQKLPADSGDNTPLN